MRVCRIALFLMLAVPCFFCGCGIPAPGSDAASLTAVFTEPFVCGFEAQTDGITVRGTLTRSAGGDRLSVTGEHGNTVFFFTGDEAFLCAGGQDGSGEAPLRIPVNLPLDSGAAYYRSFFCVIPDDGCSVRQQGDTFVVTDAAGTRSAVYSRSGTPLSLSDAKTTVTITVFTVTDDAADPVTG
ncbi:MAG: hypothetical protein ACI3XM_07230 [Eubacteriales bacterium]